MNEIFENEANVIVAALHYHVPSMGTGMAEDHDTYGYSFHLVEPTKGVVRNMKKEEVLSFYRSLVDRKQRINMWLCMKAVGWVGRREEEYITDKQWASGHY